MFKNMSSVGILFRWSQKLAINKSVVLREMAAGNLQGKSGWRILSPLPSALMQSKYPDGYKYKTTKAQIEIYCGIHRHSVVAGRKMWREDETTDKGA